MNSIKTYLVDITLQAVNNGWTPEVKPACANFVSSMLKWAGYKISFRNPNWVPDICAEGRKVTNPEKGDVVVFDRTYDAVSPPGIGPEDTTTHVGIYLGENRFAHYSSSGLKISYFDSYWKDKIAFFLEMPAPGQTENPGLTPAPDSWIDGKLYFHDDKMSFVFPEDPNFIIEIGSIEAKVRIRERYLDKPVDAS